MNLATQTSLRARASEHMSPKSRVPPRTPTRARAYFGSTLLAHRPSSTGNDNSYTNGYIVMKNGTTSTPRRTAAGLYRKCIFSRCTSAKKYT